MKSAIGIVICMWIVFGINTIIPYDLNQWGIVPRTMLGTTGIVTWSFLHGNFSHIFFNTIGLLILIPPIFAMHEKERGVDVIFGISLLAGLITWIIGTHGIHIGASGLVYGLATYALWGSIKQRNLIAGLYSIGVMLAFGTTFLTGVIPRDGISWTGHIAGAIAGVVLAQGISSDGHQPTKRAISSGTWFNSP